MTGRGAFGSLPNRWGDFVLFSLNFLSFERLENTIISLTISIFAAIKDLNLPDSPFASALANSISAVI